MHRSLLSAIDSVEPPLSKSRNRAPGRKTSVATMWCARGTPGPTDLRAQSTKKKPTSVPLPRAHPTSAHVSCTGIARSATTGPIGADVEACPRALRRRRSRRRCEPAGVTARHKAPRQPGRRCRQQRRSALVSSRSPEPSAVARALMPGRGGRRSRPRGHAAAEHATHAGSPHPLARPARRVLELELELELKTLPTFHGAGSRAARWGN